MASGTSRASSSAAAADFRTTVTGAHGRLSRASAAPRRHDSATSSRRSSPVPARTRAASRSRPSACSTASVWTVARLRPALGNAIPASVDQELTEPTPVRRAGAATRPDRAGTVTEAAMPVVATRRTGRFGFASVRMMAMAASFRIIAWGAPERAAQRTVEPISSAGRPRTSAAASKPSGVSPPQLVPVPRTCPSRRSDRAGRDRAGRCGTPCCLRAPEAVPAWLRMCHRAGASIWLVASCAACRMASMVGSVRRRRSQARADVEGARSTTSR